MTFNKLFGYGIVLAVLEGLLKWISTFVNTDVLFIVGFIWIIEAVVAVACVRRLGIINFLEAMLVCGLWLIFMLIFDVLVVTGLFHADVLTMGPYWLGAVIILLSIFFIHKKRHVDIRRKLKAK